ncbi:MAG: lysine 2,3-aminomutase [Deltaproteobacteria bacterium]|nr:lysine 2,3-aminomutase [Deltaproteobacteria bacterium]
MDWKSQLKNMIREPSGLLKYINLTKEELAQIDKASSIFPMGITPYYASLMDKNNPECPIRKQGIPSLAELVTAPGEMTDPLGEELDSPVPGLTRRYPDRALLLVTNSCFTYCRHCNRRRKVGDPVKAITPDSLNRGIDYIRNNSQIRDVLLSGGDPFFLSTKKLDSILKELFEIPHVKIVRIGTRVPVVLPQRIDDELVDMLKKYRSLWINTHFNHPKEITSESKKALAMLADAGIPLGNQTVLLKGVNDCPQILKELFYELTENRVRPYYLFQCDQAKGISHFRTPVSRGIEIMESLIGHISGFAVPVFAVDPPGGAGKIRLSPNYFLSSSPEAVVLRNYEGVITRYTEAPHVENNCPGGCAICGEPPKSGRKGAHSGVGRLLSDNTEKAADLIPENLERSFRRK